MPYIGKQPLTGAYQLCDTITTSATATYNLLVGGSAVIPGSANNCIVSLNGVVQAPVGAFTVSGSQITFASALTSSDVIDFILILGNVFDIGKPTDGSVTNASIANSTIDLTTKVTGVLPVANGGTNLSSGFANGITEADQWRITANVTLSAEAFVTSNWERNDNSGYSVLGTGMTESSGVFTFPSTGYYLIEAVGSFQQNAGASTENALFIYTTIDNSNYTQQTSTLDFGDATTDHNMATSTFIFDVTSTANCKVKFAQLGSNGVLRGATSQNRTHVTFIRLGDT